MVDVMKYPSECLQYIFTRRRGYFLPGELANAIIAHQKSLEVPMKPVMLKFLRDSWRAVRQHHAISTQVVCPECFAPDVAVGDGRRKRPCVCGTCGHEWVDRRGGVVGFLETLNGTGG
jgi:hypothetical protein